MMDSFQVSSIPLSFPIHLFIYLFIYVTLTCDKHSNEFVNSLTERKFEEMMMPHVTLRFTRKQQIKV